MALRPLTYSVRADSVSMMAGGSFANRLTSVRAPSLAHLLYAVPLSLHYITITGATADADSMKGR